MAKRLLCVLLSVLMVVAMLPTGVFAETTASVTYDYSESLLTVSNYWGTTVSDNTTVTFGGTLYAEAYVNFGNSVDLSLYDTLTFTVSNVTASSPQLKLYYSDGSNSYPSFTADGTYSVTLSSTLSYFTIQDGAGDEGGSVTLDSVTLSDSTGTNADLVCTYSESDLTVTKNWGCDISGNTVTFSSQWGQANINLPSTVDYSSYNTVSYTVSGVSGTTNFVIHYSDGTATSYSGFSADGTYTKTLAGTVDYMELQYTEESTGTVTLESITLSYVEEEEGEYIYTFDSTGSVDFSFQDYADTYSAGDTLVITVVLESTSWFGGAVGANDATNDGDYTMVNYDQDSATVVATVVAMNDSTSQGGYSTGTIYVWWLDTTVNVTSISIEVIPASTSSGTAEFYTRTLSLGGKIGINYYVNFTDVENPEDYSVKFTLSDGSTQTVTYADATSGLMSTTSDYVKFDCRVTCWNMGLTITSAQLLNGDEVVDENANYSISTYATNVASQNTALDNLMNAMLTYGHYAYVVKGSGADVSGFTDGTSSVTSSDLEEYEPDTELDSEIISAVLTLDSTCELSFTYGDDYSVSINGEGTDKVSDILVEDWDKTYTVIVTDSEGNEVYNFEYSVLSYVYSVVDNVADYDANLVSLVKAMYLYNYYADIYFASLA